MESERIMMLGMLIMNLLLKMLRIVKRMNQICGSNELLQSSPKTPLKSVPSKKHTQKQAAPKQVSELVEEFDEPKKRKGRT